MESIASHLIHSVDSLEKGSFEEALKRANEVIQLNRNNFWGWYLGAISLAFLKDKSSLIFYFEKANQILPDSIYLKYLKVYLNILEDHEISAIVELTSLLDSKNAWLARELLEKIRSGNKLKEYTKNGNVGKFILIPDLKKELLSINKHNKKLDTTKQNKKRNLFFKKVNKNYNLVVFILIGIFGFLGLLYYFYSLKNEKSLHNFDNILIPTKVNILRNLSSKKFLYSYTNLQKIIADFEKAKQLLKIKKVNQSRYILQRIIHSNADFSTKEKSKIFMSFIPQIVFEEFNDPVKAAQLVKEPLFYIGSQVLWKGIVKSHQSDKIGTQFKIIVKEKEKSFMIDAFIRQKKINSEWQPYQKYIKPKDKKDLFQNKNIVIFGKFRSLVGEKKQIYIELDKLWL